MKKAIIILSAVALGAISAKTITIPQTIIEDNKLCRIIKPKNNKPLSPREITILDGTVVLEMSKGEDFPCIGLRLSDKSKNSGLGTYLEIKKRGEFYLVESENKKYRNLDQGIEDYLKNLFDGFYDNKKDSKKVWSAFVKEGGLQLFIDITKKFIDDEFLNSPFNETYG